MAGYDDLRRQAMLSNIAQNLVAMGQRRAPQSPADVLMQLSEQERQQRRQGMADQLAQQQEQRLQAKFKAEQEAALAAQQLQQQQASGFRQMAERAMSGPGYASDGPNLPNPNATPGMEMGADMAMIPGLEKQGFEMIQANQPKPIDPYANVAKIDPSDYTVESLSKFIKSQNPDDLVFKQKDPTTEVNIDMGGKALNSFVSTQVPVLYDAARAAIPAIERINKIEQIVDSQGEGVLGVEGAINAALAPLATAFNVNTENMDNAQLINTLFGAQAGSLRVDVVGPGPVTEYEQKLLAKASGKGIAAKSALKELLGMYRKRRIEEVQDANTRIGKVSQRPGLDIISELYPALEIPTYTTPTAGGKSAIDALLEKY